ncbi:alpha/beta hydrolase, partial [Mucilaginibacter sp.]|uniref:alpha/beta hydrolase n=1 Tax=Mucilaginibacter sp. TaxID=1882438 RepID=UPI002ECFCD65
MNDFLRIVSYSNEGLTTIRELKLAPDGLPAFNFRIYGADSPGLKPVLVYFHGGNWISGNLKTCDSICAALAESSGYAVISVDYALAPEHHFPVPLYQGLAVMNWIKNQGFHFGINRKKIVAGGDNAGANIAAGLVHLINRTREYKLLGQLLVCPALHYQFDTPSYNKYEKGYFLSKTLMKQCWDTYLGHRDHAFDESASPLLVFDVNHVPKTLIYTAEHDPLQYEAELYAAVLKEQGIEVFHLRFKGVTHYFWQMDAILDTA